MNKNFIYLFVAVTFFVLSQQSFANNLDDLFQKANEAYRAENYQEAVETYRKILAQGFENFEVYYNLGNAYYRLNQIGEAVLYYEKAKQLDPNDPDLMHNLELVNLRVIDRIETPPRFFLFDWWDGIKNFYSIYQLRNVVILLFVVSVFLLIGWFFVRNYRLRQWVLSTFSVLAILTIFWIYIFFIRIQEYQENRKGVVLTPTVTVFSAPDENSTEVFVLHEGIKVTLEEQRARWMEISLPDGKTGWMESQVLGVI